MTETNCSNGDSNRITAGRAPNRFQLAIVAAILAVAAGFVIWIETGTWRQLTRVKRDLAVANLESFFLGVHVREAVLRMNGALFRFQLSGEDTERVEFRTEARALAERLRRTQAHLATEGERRIVQEVDHAFERYLQDTSGYLDRGLRGIRRDTATLLNQELSAKARSLVLLAERLVQVQQNVLANFFGSSGATVNSIQRLLFVSVFLPVVLVAAAMALLHQARIGPLRRQLNQTRAAIDRQEKLASLGVLAAGVAHEVRNPLTAIKFRLFSLKSALPEGLRDHEDLAVVHNEIHRLERIVKDFLQFARPSEPNLADVSSSLIMREVHSLLQAEMERRSIVLRIEGATAAGAPIVRADQQQIQQVLINLIQNAADSVQRGGTITLSARHGASSLFPSSPPMVTLEVSDTGRGIPPEVERRLFDPFFSTKEGGTGLGLSIAARIIEKHGGFIQYLTQLNQGTTFSVVLPSGTRHESPPPAH